MVAVIDYGVGNLFSLKCSFNAIGADVIVTSDAKQIKSADKILLPGVGAFADAAEKLRKSGLGDVLISEAAKGKPIMGICLGMQLLFDRSYEYGVHSGLGLVEGDVVPLSSVISKDLKIPQIGWNGLNIKKDSPILRNIKEGDCVYFVHSYYAAHCDNSTAATTEYSADITAVVQNRNVFGCQFHPEKSGNVGLNILRAFVDLKEGDIC